MNYTISECVCPKCNKKFPIPRSKGRARQKDHIKNIWCPFCREVVRMKEVRYNDYDVREEM